MFNPEVDDLRGKILAVLSHDHAPADKFVYRDGWATYPREVHEAALRPLVDAGWVSLFDISRSDVEPVADTPEEVWQRIDAIVSAPREERDIDLWIGLTEAGRVEAARVVRREDRQLDVLEAGIDAPPAAGAPPGGGGGGPVGGPPPPPGGAGAPPPPPGRARDLPLSAEAFTGDLRAVVDADDVDIVVEVMGGRDPAGALVRAALEAGKPVVTANKELVAHEGPALFDAAARSGVDLQYEAAVAGAIPIIKPLKESLAGDRIRRIVGILNGTTNYILTRMTEDGQTYDEALAEAQRLGYAEADPSADVDGHDAAAKCAILASLAFDSRVTAGDVYREGIGGVTAQDIELAGRLGYVVKLLAIASETPAGPGEEDAVAVRVHPAFVPKEHPLAAVRESFNAIFVQADAAGELMFYGRGAGSDPTGSAVVGDIIHVARHLLQESRGPGESSHRPVRIRPVAELRTQYYVLLDVADRPGVLASVAETFARHAVSIGQVWQEGYGDTAQLVLVTHRAREGDLEATVSDLAATDGVRSVRSVLRVESEALE
jgi:homoserine dehydrogenase